MKTVVTLVATFGMALCASGCMLETDASTEPDIDNEESIVAPAESNIETENVDSAEQPIIGIGGIFLRGFVRGAGWGAGFAAGEWAVNQLL